jgi:hypothetical protein
VESLRQWLHRGPKTARVATVRELDSPAAGEGGEPGNFSQFSIE